MTVSGEKRPAPDPYDSKGVRLLGLLLFVIPAALVIGFILFGRLAVLLAGGWSLREAAGVALGFPLTIWGGGLLIYFLLYKRD